MDTTGAILFFGLVLLVLLLGVGAYYGVTTGVLGEAWDRFKAFRAARRAHVEEVREAQRRERDVEVGLRPEVVLDGAIQAMTRRGYSLEDRTPHTATFARHEAADACLGCILMLFFFLPGLLYFLLSPRIARVTFAAYPIEGGARLVIGGDHPRAVFEATEWAKELPKVGESVPELLTSTSAIESSAPAERSAGEALRELAQLRDAGLITSEEFEAKKAEILRRM